MKSVISGISQFEFRLGVALSCGSLFAFRKKLLLVMFRFLMTLRTIYYNSAIVDMAHDDPREAGGR